MVNKLLPLVSVSDFLAWKPGQGAADARAKALKPLPAAPPEGTHPKLLVCHDLQGGYGDDSLLLGGSDPDQFSLCSWHLVDVFVYFSHSLVTIPPPGWTDAAHLHGTQVLGTFITEGGDGTDACQELFRSMESAVEAAKQLASIAAYFGFEGWLINVENCLGQEDVPHLLNFVRCGEGCDVCQW